MFPLHDVLEPANPLINAQCVTNEISETCFMDKSISRQRSTEAPWWSLTGSNRRPHACKARALPTELRPHFRRTNLMRMVGLGRLELPTSRLSSARSNQLSYKPTSSLKLRRLPPCHPFQESTNSMALCPWKKEKRRRRYPACRV